jgi:hypothetical protein
MMDIKKLIKKIMDTDDCFVSPSKGLPNIPSEYKLPKDLEDFYKFCGGAMLYQSSAYGIEIVNPDKFIRANPVIRDEEGKDDISYHWYIVGKSDEQIITIDLNESRNGRCYDSFWDRHAMPGNCPIIAESFADLLQNLLNGKGVYWYWLEDKFHEIGDAYD